MRFIIFFAVVISVFGLAGYYIYTRFSQAFGGTFLNSRIVTYIYIFLVSSIFIGYMLQAVSVNFLSETLVKIGSTTLGILFYVLLFLLFFDLLRLINHFLPFFPEFITANYQKAKLIAGVVTLISVICIVIYGFFNADNTSIVKLELKTNKPIGGKEQLNIVALSDIHLGTTVNHSELDRMIREINKLDPDIVLLGGDITDNNIKVVQHYKLLERFGEIKSKYGIYSCMGNHDYISRANEQLDYYTKNGINILKDTSVLIDNRFWLVGRDDHTADNFNGKKRKTVSSLIKDVDTSLPVILLDHQPFKLQETSKHPVDLQFSGHTHKGQFWPLGYITGKMFEKDWGYIKKGNTHFYISSGFGPRYPDAAGTQSEIIKGGVLKLGLKN
ncbi:MAG: metallophosphoesterase [Saprospiraceae bacterium]|nr:metallophosphoesterase [Saprospiraceae bacterium]